MDDVIVVGAGPAGNNVAYRLASLGYAVSVVDSRTQIGDKLCTGIVGRECIQRFPIDSSLIYQDASSARVVAPGGESAEFGTEDVQAHVIDRVAYVSSFAEMAHRAGATYHLGCRVTEVSTSSEDATVRLTHDAGILSLKARALVLASGFGSELTGQVGLGKAGDFATGVQAEVLAPSIDQIHVYFGRDVAPGFFAWLVPTCEGKALAGLLSRHHTNVFMERLLLKLQMEGQVTAVTKPPSRWGVPLRPLARTTGERLLVVGDAAGQAKPTTGGGIYYALRASEIAADTLHQGLSRNDLSESRLMDYEREWKSLLSREMEVGYTARRLFESLKDTQVDFLLHTVATNGIYKKLVGARSLAFDWHSGIINKIMGQPILTKTLNAVNPLLATLVPHS